MKATRKQIGTIGVDAGICWVGDPCYILHQKETPKAIGKNWRQFCKSLGDEYPTLKQFKYNAGHPGLGVVVSTGYGDGLYPVYVEMEGNRVARVIVEFIGEDDEEE